MIRPSHILRSRLLPLALMCAAAGWPAGAALASSPPPLTVVLTPCSAPTPSAGCRLDPAQIQVDVPTNNSVAAVQLSWVPGVGRPGSAPSPASSQVVLAVSAPASCQNPVAAPSGFAAVCWNWPASLTFASGGTSWILNGTYRVTPCSGTSSSSPCSYSTQFNSTLAEVAVPPSPPAQVSATQANGAVTLTWRPGPEPDLVGYTVSRDNQAVYTCSTDGAGPGAGTPCANPPSLHDQPGSGTWSYTVTALRFGIDASAAHVVSSAPSPGSVSVPAPPPSASGGAGGAGGAVYTPGAQSGPGRGFVPALPSVGVMRPVGQMTASGGVAGSGVPSLADMEDSGGALGGSAAALPYSDNPAMGGALASGSLVSAQKAGDNLDATAELALSVLALAMAVHVWYLRGQLRLAAVRVAARRAAEGSAA